MKVKIDMHVHVTPPDIINNLEKYCINEPYFSLLSHSPKNKFATAEDVVAEMQRVGFDRSVVFGFAFQDQGLCNYVNDYVVEKTKEFPQSLIGFLAVNPKLKNVENVIVNYYKKGLRGIGELFPAGQNFELAELRDTAAFASACIAHKMPVLLHTNEQVGHYYAGKTNTKLEEIEQFVEHHPDLKLILAHWGGGIFFYELMKELKENFKNVYYDNAATIFLYDAKIYQIAKELGIMDKVLFGSDFPLLSPERYWQGIAESKIDQEDLNKLFGHNALKLFEDCGISLE
ncbi:MAG: amidohydrolase family protein [Clostridia bacterium]